MKTKSHTLFFASVLSLSFFLVPAPVVKAQDPAAAPPQALIDKGRELFTSKDALGGKFACILCHKNDKAVKKSTIQKLGDKLPLAINKNLTERAKGKKLAEDSEEMQALVAYMRHEHGR